MTLRDAHDAETAPVGVTGATGRIGGRVARRLAAKGVPTPPHQVLQDR